MSAMLKRNSNILLQKDDVGMPKPSVRNLPVFGHSYGLPGARDPEGVKDCKLMLRLKTLDIVFY